MDDRERFQLDEIYQRNTLEWFALRHKFDQDVQFKQGRELLEWKRREIRELMNLLKDHLRDLDYRAGEHKPEVLFGEIDFQGKGTA